MKGANWWTSDKMADKNQASYFHSQINTAPKLTIQISGEAIQQSGVIEWQTSSGAIIDSKMAAASTHVFGRCVSKQLYINDADEKRKRVEVLAKVQLGNGLHLGTFQSKGIKVISKPSKKRQSVKNMECKSFFSLYIVSIADSFIICLFRYYSMHPSWYNHFFI